MLLKFHPAFPEVINVVGGACSHLGFAVRNECPQVHMAVQCELIHVGFEPAKLPASSEVRKSVFRCSRLCLY